MITPEDIRLVRFESTRFFERGYQQQDVDRFLDEVENTLEQLGRERTAPTTTGSSPQSAPPQSAAPQSVSAQSAADHPPMLTPQDIHHVAFSKPPMGKRGYNEDEVDQFLDDVEATVRQLRERLSKYEEI